MRYETTGSIDGPQTQGIYPCDAVNPCLLLHNGAKMMLGDESFGGTATTNLIWFLIDPDGKANGTVNGLQYALYFNGRVATYGTITAGSATSNGPETACPACDPPWFSWN